ncbi:hypothetical protein [Streptosporangium sp. NPDC023615]|uniref:hypothetical protein n=1 Tax=Streptosporangium sp. NPDC023615 TaxID=3154794 RepID=UPI003418C29D
MSRSRIARVLVALLLFGFLFYWSLFFAFLTQWSIVPSGRSHLEDAFPGLLCSLAAGVAAFAVFRWVMGWAARSWWLLLAFAVPLWQAVMLVL